MKRRRLVVSPQAQRDIAVITGWYRREMGPAAAASALKTLRAGIVAATRINPESARREDLPDGYFRVVAKAHLVIFQIGGGETRIVRVVHGARDVPPLLR
jgi:plasmid stabilization system protein ParE